MGLINVSAAVIVRKHHDRLEILSARRTEPEHLRGGWEFPGGKWEDNEDAISCLHREIDEELGVDIEVHGKVAGPLTDDAWQMTDIFALHVFVCTLLPGRELELREQHDALEWLPIESAETAVGWLAVDIPPLRAAIAWLGTHPLS